MKKTACITVFFFLWAASAVLAAQSPAGKWKTIDDETNREMSIIEIYEDNGVFFGRILELLQEKDGGRGLLCDKCKGDDYNKPIVGMVILKGLKADGDAYAGGTILDPDNGKTYRCRIEVLDGGARLKVRGFIGVSLIGRNQFWLKVP